MSEKKVVDNPKEHRYELLVDADVAGYVQYDEVATGVVLTHTEVLPEHEGKGYGSQLARGTLEAVRARGKKVIPVCHFIAGYLRKHPEYVDVVEPDVRKAFGI